MIFKIQEKLQHEPFLHGVQSCFKGGWPVRVTGKVVNKEQPVPYANFRVNGTAVVMAADRNGDHTLAGIPSGSGAIEVCAVEHGSMHKMLNVPDGRTVRFDFSCNLEAFISYLKTRLF
ncbi:MAG: hypothetical protein MI684_10005 [Chlorobiales bacterium]|nr:hypothetical protein [Chlorobiales bacterium]